MQFLTPEETIKRFGNNGFYVDSSQAWYRIDLVLNHPQVDKQGRIGGRPSEFTALPWLAHQLVNWLPAASSRLLWISHWENDFLSFGETVLAMRRGLGELRSLSHTPGHYFEEQPFAETDCLALSPEQSQEINQLCGLIGLVILAQWDGWLISDNGIDRVEFWEGNLFFHSIDRERLNVAKRLMADCKCRQKLR